MMHDAYPGSRLLVLLPLALLACGSPESTRSGLDERSTEASAVSAAATLVVNAGQVLRPVTHVATGSLYGLANATQPSDALVQAIKPNTFVQMPSGGRQQPDGDILKVAPTAARAGARLVDRLSDYYAGWPYQFSWSTWTPFVNSQIAAMKASPYYGSIAAYELWNESDNTWRAANGTYEAFWTTTFRQVRALDPTKPIQGPSFSDNISDMRNFLTNAVATNTVPDILAWHELTRSSKIAGDVAAVLQIEKDLGITPRPIAIEEYAAPSEVGIPGPLVGYIAKFERLGIQDAELAFWNQSGTLGDLLTSKGGSPNAAYWLYTWYAAMSGNMVVTIPPAQTGIDGFAAVPAGNNQVSIVVGGCNGACAVTVNGLDALNLGATVNVKIEQTVSLGRTVASAGPSTVSTTTYTPSSGSISVPITMATNDAYRVTITPGSQTGQKLTVSRSGSGTGTVTSSSGGVSCGSTCTATYASGTAVTLTATAAAGSTFSGWSGACVGAGTCIVTMTANQAVTATFVESAPPGPISISAGGPASGAFVADTDYSGGSTYSTTNAIDTSPLTGTVPPQSVLQHERYGAFTYTIPGLTPGGAYAVTLYFAESYWTAAGQRLFDVAINGTSVLSAFDIFAAAGGANKAIARTFDASASSSGQVVIAFTAGSIDNPKVDGVAVADGTGPTSYPLTVTTAGTGAGTVAGGAIDCGSTCRASVVSGTAVTLTATAASGSTFAGWSGACSGTGVCAVTMTAAQTVTATFTAKGGTCTAVSGGQSGNFNTTGASCFTVSGTIHGWGCSNADGRSVTVNDVGVTCGQMPLPGSSPYTFSFTAGTYAWASFYWW